MAHTRVEEVFVANQVFGNNLSNLYGTGFTNGTNLQTQTAVSSLQALSNQPIHNVVGLINADSNSLILSNADLVNSRYVRFFQTHRNRRVRYSDLIDRKRITKITRGTWRHYHPIIYRLDFSNINSALAGDHIVMGFQLRHEEDFCYLRPFIEHTFTATGGNQDILAIVNKINEVSVKLSKGFRPFKAFTGNATGSVIDFNAPDPNKRFIYIIAGKREVDRQNIRQLEIYDFDVLITSCYQASTKTTFNGTYEPIIPGFNRDKGTIGLATYPYNSDKPIGYDEFGDPISKIAGSTFNSVNTNTLPKPQDENGFYEDILSNLYQNDLGQVLGHQNRIWLPDQVELPNIIKTIVTTGAGIDITNRYNSIHIEYETDAIDSTQQNQNLRKNKRFTLYVNASLFETGNLLNNGNYPTSTWNNATNGFNALINNLML